MLTIGLEIRDLESLKPISFFAIKNSVFNLIGFGVKLRILTYLFTNIF